MKLKFEANLPHQQKAVDSTLSIFDKAIKEQKQSNHNPLLSSAYINDNIIAIQKANHINQPPTQSNVIDIAMETGTGKTYTYTKTMFELHKTFGIFKFIIIVPTLSIKAGTKQFLQSPDLIHHFRTDFGQDYDNVGIKLYTVQSQKSKSKKSFIPNEIYQFLTADNAKNIHILLINAGMINSDTLAGTNKDNDGSFLFDDEYDKPIDAIASIRPFVIIDEPHKFKKDNKTWGNILKLNPQYILRYGATFDNQFENLIYQLTAIDAFNDDLVKGVRTHITQIENDNGDKIKLIDLTGNQAIFEFNHQIYHLDKNDNLNTIHSYIDNLFIENMNKSIVELSNGIVLKKGDKLNPFSYSDNVRNQMIRKAIKTHFDLEQELLMRDDGKIKPLTLFFIDDIASYRNENGSLKITFEQFLQAELQHRIQDSDNDFLKSHWQIALDNLSITHGGYFSKDNSDKDEKIEQEINEILHDKQKLLDLDNPRRFIFSKWTLREGWDNPNVFGICKLRSSGSETSKLQEVGRGLRLPVNEYGGRVKTHFYLNYFVDSSESDFVQKLTDEVNSNISQEMIYTQLNDELIEKIQTHYPDLSKKSIRGQLSELTDDDDNFTQNGFDECKKLFTLAFTQKQLKNNKITNNDKNKPMVKMREGHYQELKALWEAINQKAILSYDINDESAFAKLFKQFLLDNQHRFKPTVIRTKQQELRVQNNVLNAVEIQSLDDEFEPICTMTYRDFLFKLSQSALIKVSTLHQIFCELKNENQLDIRQYLNEFSINIIKNRFNDWLLLHSFNHFEVSFTHIGGAIHPTKFTNIDGNPKSEILASDLGVDCIGDKPLKQFLFESVFFDSDLEKQNLTQSEIEQVQVFTKIPKNSIKIPVAGGKSYSPDFAYIIKTANGDILNLILESKNVDSDDDLRLAERQKIKHAEKLFNEISFGIKVVFKEQFKQDNIRQIIESIIHQESVHL